MIIVLCCAFLQIILFLGNYAVLKIICTPESVETGSLSSPTLKAKAASSKGFCICPAEKNPKSPPFEADEQSLYFEANSSNVASLFTIFSRKACKIFKLCRFKIERRL